MTAERWVTILGHPKYEISTQGNIRNKDTGKLLKPILGNSNRYYRVSLDGKKCYVHRLVANSFLEQPYGASNIRHINGDRLDNSLENLEWIGDSGGFDDGYIDPDEATGEEFFEGC